MNIMMRVNTPKQREWSKDLLDKAIEFHGHGGPFMIVGLRMGLTALNLFKAKGWFDMTCCMDLPLMPPHSCVIDGVQVATGCTMGKRNIEVRDGEGISGEFTTDKERARLRLKSKFLEMIKGTLALSDDKATQALMEEMIEANDLFEIELCPGPTTFLDCTQ